MNLQQIVFLIILAATFAYAYKQYAALYRKIKLGKEEKIEGDSSQRWKNVLLVAFGQKKMFKRFIPAVLHLFIYVAFLFTQVELIEIIIDGVFGAHRFFADKIGFLYPLMISTIEILSVLAFVATFIFLARRNLLKIPRFKKPEMEGWPTLDANLILIGELFLLVGIFSMNGADIVLQNMESAHFKETGIFAISEWLGPAMFSGFSESSLIGIERFGWWLHILVVFGFINYLPKSKHLHILLAFPNVYYASLSSRGEMENMPAIMNEVKSMMGLQAEQEVNPEEELPDFGSKDITGFSWKTILDAYTCTECGRCSSMCPANQTGKKLSPRKIMMDIRDRTDEIAALVESAGKDVVGFDDGKSLFDYISHEELFACTTCNACVEACPVMIDPLKPILEMRRYVVLTESGGPQDWLPMFNSVENSGAVWQMPEERAAWTKQLDDA